MNQPNAGALPEFVGNHQFIDDYKEIEEVMRSPYFHQSGAPERRIFFGDTLIFAEDERHAQLRDMFRPLMSRDAMAYYELNLLEPVIDDVFANLTNSRGADGLVKAELVSLVRVMLHRISAGVTGIDDVTSPDRVERFANLLSVLGEAVTAQWTKGEMGDVIAHGREALSKLVGEYLQPSLDRRLSLAEQLEAGVISLDELPRDMLMTLCIKKDVYHPQDSERIPYVWQQCALFSNAAIHATSQTLPNLVVDLNQWIREHPEDKASLTDHGFLRQAAREALRLHQSSPVKFRVAVKDVMLSTGRQVAAGETVALGTMVANRRPEIFGADSDKFNPHRQSPAGMMPWGLTFGSGKHSCFGANLVIGVAGKADQKLGTDGTLVKIASRLFQHGCELDPSQPPVRTSKSFHDAYESVPVLFQNIGCAG